MTGHTLEDPVRFETSLRLTSRKPERGLWDE